LSTIFCWFIIKIILFQLISFWNDIKNRMSVAYAEHHYPIGSNKPWNEITIPNLQYPNFPEDENGIVITIKTDSSHSIHHTTFLDHFESRYEYTTWPKIQLKRCLGGKTLNLKSSIWCFISCLMRKNIFVLKFNCQPFLEMKIWYIAFLQKSWKKKKRLDLPHFATYNTIVLPAVEKTTYAYLDYYSIIIKFLWWYSNFLWLIIKTMKTIKIHSNSSLFFSLSVWK
jgi:hypothetical protein